MSHHHRHREDSGFDEAQLDEATRQSVQDAYGPPPAASYEDEQAQIRRAEQESEQDAYSSGYGQPQGHGGYGRGAPERPSQTYGDAYQEGYARRPQESDGYGRGGRYQEPPQGFGGESQYARTDERYGYGERLPRQDQPPYAPPPGLPPNDGDQFSNTRYSAPPGPPPVDDYGRPQYAQPEGEEHHRRHHHHEEEGGYTPGRYGNQGGEAEYGSRPGAGDTDGYKRPRPPISGYPIAAEMPQNLHPGATGTTGQHHGAAAEFYNNEPPRRRPEQEAFYDAPEAGDGDESAPATPPKPPQNAPAPSRPNLQNAANFASTHRQDSVEDQQMYHAAAAHAASQQDDDDEPPPTVHPHTINSSSTPTQMGQAAAMQALQHLTGAGGAGAAAGIASILGGLTGGGGAGAAIGSLLGGGAGGGHTSSGAPSGPPSAESAAPGPSTGNAQGGGAGAPSDHAAAAAAQGAPPPASPYEKLIAVAMMKASEMFDKNGSGDPAAKQQAIQAAASTVMKLINRYQSGPSGAGSQFQPGEIQGLFSTFMKAFM